MPATLNVAMDQNKEFATVITQLLWMMAQIVLVMPQIFKTAMNKPAQLVGSPPSPPFIIILGFVDNIK